jgi:hypothetical protein
MLLTVKVLNLVGLARKLGNRLGPKCVATARQTPLQLQYTGSTFGMSTNILGSGACGTIHFDAFFCWTNIR